MPIMSEEEQTKLMELLRNALGKLSEAVEGVDAVCSPMVDAAKDCPLHVHIFMYHIMNMTKKLLSEADTVMNKGMPICAERASKIMMATFQDEAKMFGYIFKPDKDTHYNVKKEDKPLMISWMKQHPIGKEFVKEEVHHAVLKKFLDDEFTDKGNDPPSFVSAFKVDALVVRKQRAGA